MQSRTGNAATDIFLEALAQGPERLAPYGKIEQFAGGAADATVRAIASLWSRHRAQGIRVGDLWMDDSFLEDSFTMPTFTRDPGDDPGVVDVHYDKPRTDVFAIGRTQSGSSNQIYAFVASSRSFDYVTFKLIDVDRGTETMEGSFESFLLYQSGVR